MPKDAKQIDGTLNWATPDGKIYGQETRTVPNRFHKNLKFPVKHYGEYFVYSKFHYDMGYEYCVLKHLTNEKDKYKKISHRVNRIIAETFIPNPKNLPIVGHKNNIKNDNRVENLYWTDYKENIQKAVNDKLLINDSGYDDSQSKPVFMFETKTNKIIDSYGSCREAAEKTGISLTTICRQAKYKRPVRKDFYFRYQDDESI